MRDTTKLHPRLQEIAPKLITECAKEGISIGIGECVRTVAEQDAIYAQGRTTPGIKVTNAKGSSYNSMHQWGAAFDFFLTGMDVDKDGITSDDTYNDNTGLFEKVGAIGKSLGLEWGGDWKSPVDRPHFQLPDWGSTPAKLKSQYGTPDKFMKTWVCTPTKTINQKSPEKDIEWLQNKLNKAGLGFQIPVTKKYDFETRVAVLRFAVLQGWTSYTTATGYSAGLGTIDDLSKL